jgi:hypothetical protein
VILADFRYDTLDFWHFYPLNEKIILFYRSIWIIFLNVLCRQPLASTAVPAPFYLPQMLQLTQLCQLPQQLQPAAEPSHLLRLPSLPSGNKSSVILL